MKIRLRTFATFREIIGAQERELSLPGRSTVGELLEGLCQSYPALRPKLFDAGGSFRSYNIILKNGRSIASLQQLDTVVEEGDAIALFPPVAGG